MRIKRYIILIIILIIAGICIINVHAENDINYDFLVKTKWVAPFGIEVKEVLIKEIKYDGIICKSKYTNNFYLLDVQKDNNLTPLGGIIPRKIQFYKNNKILILEDTRKNGISFIYERLGEIKDANNLLLGKWSRTDENKLYIEIKTVKPDNYQYMIWLPALSFNKISKGDHLLKRVSNDIFESDETFGGDQIQLKIIDKEYLYVSQEGAEEGLQIYPVKKLFKNGKIPTEEELEKSLMKQNKK